LPLNQWVELLDSLYGKGLRFIKISGGEPFLYAEILKLLEYAQNKFIVSLNTNGYFIDENIARQLSTMHLEAVQISLDSTTSKIHDSLRGRGSWEKANNAIHLLHSMGVPIRISTTVMAENYNELADIRLLADKLGVELSFEVLKNNGRAFTIGTEYFITDPEKVRQCSYESNSYRILSELEMACQSQLGAVGISYRGNIKPCNLTEEFFAKQNADVVVRFEKNWRYSDSSVLASVNKASDKVINLLKDGCIKTKEKCIFEY
jgi:MoaA/NifB/PqqE/SkfB family radical SAM enzyme